MTRAQSSYSNMKASEMKKLKGQKFALLARVGHQKKKASVLHEEATFYSTIVTELLASSGEALEFLVSNPDLTIPHNKLRVAQFGSRRLRLIKRLLSYWPPDTESQQRLWSLLTSAGLGMDLVRTSEGSVTLSMDRILNNVARTIEATKELSQSH